MSQLFDDVGECVEATLRRVGKRLVVALPLALGKPVPLVNELYRRALRDPSIELKIFTALSLRKPQASSELERRFLEPFVARVFGSYPELEYTKAVRAGRVPSNIRVVEFYLEPGAYLGSSYAQQHYLSANYTQVAREVLKLGVNVIAQMVAKRTYENRTEYSLSCNPDVTLDILPEFDARRRAGTPVVFIGAVNPQLPFMLGDAVIQEAQFDFVLDHPRYEFDLYCPPNLALGSVDYLIGLYASALVQDGGTLQLGIGELGDAIVYCLQQRHQQNAIWRQVLDGCRARERFGAELKSIGGEDIFDEGLYGCTEMFVDGFLDLYRSGILKRRVYPDLEVQRRLNAGERLDHRHLSNGAVLHGGFFLGPKGFYAALRALPQSDRCLFNMTGVSYINELYGTDMALKAAQRRKARFINTSMMMTLLGAAVSDTLEDGRVVSGVGGQYNFVAMAHALADARSILAVRATRTKDGRTTSNFVWNHGQPTIPRHLRDVVVSEYGIADVRGKTDADTIAALLNIADSRFQPQLLRQAQTAGKLPRDYRIPDRHCNNTPESLEKVLAPHRRAGLFSEYPFGTDFTAEEIVLAKALKRLKERTVGPWGKVATLAAGMSRPGIPAALRPYLQRLKLDAPRSAPEWILQKLVAGELRRMMPQS